MTSADDEPPTERHTWPPVLPGARPAVPVSAAVVEPLPAGSVRVKRGRIATTRDVVAIVRDVIIIALLIAGVTVLGDAIMSAVDRVPGVGGAGPTAPAGLLPCPTPTTDEYGTFCPDTPAGR